MLGLSNTSFLGSTLYRNICFFTVGSKRQFSNRFYSREESLGFKACKGQQSNVCSSYGMGVTFGPHSSQYSSGFRKEFIATPACFISHQMVFSKEVWKRRLSIGIHAKLITIPRCLASNAVRMGDTRMPGPLVCGELRGCNCMGNGRRKSSRAHWHLT